MDWGRKTANINVKILPFYNNVWGPSLNDAYNTAKMYYITYVRDHWGDKINACCFICVTQRWALHVIKGQFLTLILSGTRRNWIGCRINAFLHYTRISANADIVLVVPISHSPLPKLDSLGLQPSLLSSQYRSSSSECNAVGSKSCRFVWNNARWRSLDRSRLMKDIDFGTDRQPICDLVNN